ncbi:Hypothetical protein PBC10988_32670 [Planctomycetales bacterium 10988]|nr:Hypothetical protein PBC10988_32670 [Planctomycetales bacterium 10988]
MTDQELIALVQEKSFEDWTPEEWKAIRERLGQSLPLQQNLLEELSLQQALTEELGTISLTVDGILAKAEQQRSARSRFGLFRRWDFFFGVFLLLLFSSGILFWFFNAEKITKEDLAQNNELLQPTPLPNSSAISELPNGVEEPDLEVIEPQDESKGNPGMGETKEPPLPPEFVPPPNTMVENSPEGTDPSEDGSSEESTSETATVAANWPEETSLFKPIVQEKPLTTADLSTFFEPLGESPAWEENSRIVFTKGLVRFRPQWKEGMLLRLAPWNSRDLTIYCWQELSGVALHFQQGQSWVAYRIERDSVEQFEPERKYLLCDDQGTTGRLDLFAVELRFQEGDLLLSRGDLLLLQVPFDGLPNELILAGYCEWQHLDYVQSVPFPPDELAVPSEETQAALQPASTLDWLEVDAKTTFEILPDSETARLQAPESGATEWIGARCPQGFYYYEFQISEAAPGMGVFLGNEKGFPQACLGFYQQEEDGELFVDFTTFRDRRSRKSIRTNPEAWVQLPVWVRIFPGLQQAEAWVSHDGLHWAKLPRPQTLPQAPLSTVGLFGFPGDPDRAITLTALRVRPLPGLQPILKTAAPNLPADSLKNLASWWEATLKKLGTGKEADLQRSHSALQVLATRPPSTMREPLFNSLVKSTLYGSLSPTEKVAALRELSKLDEIHRPSRFASWDEVFLELIEEQVNELDLRSRLNNSLRWPASSTSNTNLIPLPTLQQALLTLLEAKDFDTAFQLCRQVRFWNQKATSGAAAFLQPSLVPWLDWAEATIASRGGWPEDEPSLPYLERTWQHPLQLELSKEGYNLWIEFQSALENNAYEDACRILASSEGRRVGLMPSGEDENWYVSLPKSVGIAMEQHPRLRETMERVFAPMGRIRLQEAMREGDINRLERLIIQFHGTSVASDAWAWLGKYALARGEFEQSAHAFRQAIASAGEQKPSLEALLQVANAMQGRNPTNFEPTPLTVADESLTVADTQHLLQELYQQQQTTPKDEETRGVATSQPTRMASFPPASYGLNAWLDWTGEEGSPTGRAPFEEVDWQARELSGTFHGIRWIVSNRYQVACFNVNSGKELWKVGLENEQGKQHRFPLQPMEPLVAEQRVFVRRLTNRGIELAAFDLKQGEILWRRQLGKEMLADPVWHQEAVYTLIEEEAGAQESRIELVGFDQQSGEVSRRIPLFDIQREGLPRLTATLSAKEEGLFGGVAGILFLMDSEGNLGWLRKEPWVAPELPPAAALMQHEAPYFSDENLFSCQPGVPYLTCLTRTEGRKLWRTSVVGLQRIVGQTRGHIVVETNIGFVGIHRRTGTVNWRHHDPDKTGAVLAGGKEGLCYITLEPLADRRKIPCLVWVDGRTGQEIARSSLPELAGTESQLGPFFTYRSQNLLFARTESTEAIRTIYQLTAAGKPSPGRDSPNWQAWQIERCPRILSGLAAAFPNWFLLDASADRQCGLSVELEETNTDGDTTNDPSSRKVHLRTRTTSSHPLLLATTLTPSKEEVETSEKRFLVLRWKNLRGSESKLEVSLDGENIWQRVIDPPGDSPRWEEARIPIPDAAAETLTMKQTCEQGSIVTFWEVLRVETQKTEPKE